MNQHGRIKDLPSRETWKRGASRVPTRRPECTLFCDQPTDAQLLALVQPMVILHSMVSSVIMRDLIVVGENSASRVDTSLVPLDPSPFLHSFFNYKDEDEAHKVSKQIFSMPLRSKL